MERVGIGIIGCGNISEAYLKAAATFPLLDVRGVADLRPEAARARADAFDLTAMTVEALLADPSIDIVVNLTVPAAHVEVGLRAIEAGKHVHSEKPLGLGTKEARTLLDRAADRGLRVGCAPDTFLGGAHQTCRKLVDEGAIGRPVAATAFFMCPGHERWHPNPAFFYAAGGGPMFDMGPYYITDLVNLLGHVEQVAGMTARWRDRREITSQPLAGQTIQVEVATHVAGTLRFVSGAVATIAMSLTCPSTGTLRLNSTGRRRRFSYPTRTGSGAQSRSDGTRHGPSAASSTSMRTAIIGSSAWPTLLMRSGRAAPTARPGNWRTTFSR
jgi:predicted dehydrogenase